MLVTTACWHAQVRERLMRKWFVGLLLLIALPLLASAYWHDRQRSDPHLAPSAAPLIVAAAVSAPTITPATEGTPVGLCFNYGHDTQTYDLSQTGKVAQDLQRLKNSRITCIRIAYYAFNDVQSKALSLFAAARGFYVIIGGQWGTLNSSQLAEYSAQVIQQATWAQANGIPQFSVGNEQEYRLSGISTSQWANTVVALAAQVHTVYSGKVSYETSGDFADSWAKVNLRSLDLLGLNLYGGYTFNASVLQENITAHGASHVYASETNCDIAHVADCRTDAGLANEVEGDLMKLIKRFPQTAFYAFTWRSGGTDPAYWGLINYPATLAVLGVK